uniref:Uncharacterized protein n=1 Tax=Romanomermis culicivorax TaxID=13658 RepID=A0A915KXG3_ROMCU
MINIRIKIPLTEQALRARLRGSVSLHPKPKPKNYISKSRAIHACQYFHSSFTFNQYRDLY